MAVTRSPMLRAPQRSAGPPWSRLAMTAVGSSDPQPDSTSATPRASPGRFWMQTWGPSRVQGAERRAGSQQEQGHIWAVWAGRREGSGPMRVGLSEGTRPRGGSSRPGDRALVPWVLRQRSKCSPPGSSGCCRSGPGRRCAGGRQLLRAACPPGWGRSCSPAGSGCRRC